MRATLISLLTALVVLAGVIEVHARVTPRVLAETNGSITIEFIYDGINNVAPQATFLVAIPATGGYSVSFDPGQAVEIADPPAFIGGLEVDSLRAAAAADTVEQAPPFPHRGVRVLPITVDLFGFPPGTASVIRFVRPAVTVTYDPAPRVNDAESADPLLRQLVINETVFPAGDPATSPDPFFSRAPGWVRIGVSERGVYRLTGKDLADLGVPIASINDAASFRMFSLFGLDQPRPFNDPSGTWRRGVTMDEAAILIDDTEGDGAFDLDDSIVFYAVGPEGWRDLYEPGAADTLYHEHKRASTCYYYLTWDASLDGSPARMSSAPAAPAGGAVRTTYRHREYREIDRVGDLDFRGDGWLWLEIPRTGDKTFPLSPGVAVSNLVAGVPQVFRTIALAKYDPVGPKEPDNLNDHFARYRVRRPGVDEVITEYRWTSGVGVDRYEEGEPVRHEGMFLADGVNTLALQVPQAPENPNPKDFMYFAWFALEYERRLIAGGGKIGFSSPDTAGTLDFDVRGVGGGEVYALDVTDMRNPVRLTGVDQTGGAVRFSATIAGDRRHYWLADESALTAPSDLRWYTPTDLRAASTAPAMLIVTHPSLLSAAQRLRSYRLASMPYYSNPSVRIATVDDIFDNFSGGMPDAMAIRNYVKFLYDNHRDANGNPTLAFVVLLGDANEDFNNHASVQPDLVPTNLYFTRLTQFTFVTDEWYGLLDPEDQAIGYGYLNVALGRLPAENLAEANRLVQKIIDYETLDTTGPWRKEVILVADDELSSSRFACDTQFTTESELIAYAHAANFVEISKIYLTEYRRISGVKPASRAAFLDAWSDGALIVNYIGHGSSAQMADEQVFLNADVGLLNNGARLPVLLALSCTIGDFANRVEKSLSEKLLFREGGGVIGTVTASKETFANLNNRLNFALFQTITPDLLPGERPTVGDALARAKVRALAVSDNDFSQEENNWKYNLMTDPALRLRTPEQGIRFEGGASDTLTAGLRKTVRGSVYRDGAVDASFDGTVRIEVREPEVDRVYETECRDGRRMFYRVPGGVMYSGLADVVDGRFEVDFRVPRFSRTGTRAFVTAYADDGRRDAAATEDSMLVVVPPTIADSTALRPVDGAPRVDLGFKSGLETVKPGETLQAIVRDGDGINILETTNEGRQAILFDDITVPIDVNEFFEFDFGGTDTSGVLLFPLPDLSFGEHRAIYKVSDAFGQTTLDTLFFSVTDPRDFSAEVVLNYPNPFEDATRFMLRLSDRADIRLDIFTLSGKRIRRIRDARGPGQTWVHWDGRDAHGGEIANGVYLYVATIDFVDVDRPPLVLRGKISKIE